ncbi:hypothetical protein [Oceanicoccus sp. KOV_DT_Chl]|uniref:hypothetical protein n=1 Tax=Oceanicoccus sp. KOV_DT_Chl TaxID=1904639 RepID=UPI000C797EAA|nr:hypothetical protein [Oceanicoccus sp. KOV_DT_Chl]
MSLKIKFIFIGVAVLLVINATAVGYFYFYLPMVIASAQDTESVLAETDVSASADVMDTEDYIDVAADGFSDDYYMVHFNYGDAVDLCMNEARSRNSNLIQLVVNEHSTRFNTNAKMYLVTLESYVGTPMLYDEKKHTCDVDPKVQGVTFYKEIIRRKAVRPVP